MKLFRFLKVSFGETSCFPLAFGLPAVLLIVATLFFLLGSKNYIHRPLNGSVLSDVSRVFRTAIKEKYKKRNNEQRLNHWIDYAAPLYDSKLITEVKSLLSVLSIFVPISLFWMIYDQQGKLFFQIFY